MANRVDNAKPAAEKPAGKETPEAAPAAAAAAVPASGGIKPFIPLIANLVLMPALAYAMTAFVLVPKLAKKAAPAGEAHEEAASSHEKESGHEKESAHGSKEEPEAKDAHGAPVGAKGGKNAASLSKKTLVNVAGTLGTRYLLAEFTLIGPSPSLKDKVEKHDAELRDAAASALSVKTIADLEKPGVRNLVRSELITIFNSILGKGSVSEIYLTEFAIQ